MKFQHLAAFTLSSSLLVTTLGTSLLFPQVSFAKPVTETLIAQEMMVLASGNFVTVEQDHPTTGQVRIIRENGKRYLELDKAFTTATGPDVQIILYKGATVPQSPSEKDYMILTKLKSFDGAQRYEIPANVKLDQFKSVAIWCQKFNVTFGYAML